MSIENEKEIVKKAAAGDKDAFRLLFEAYYPKVYNAAFQVLRNPSDAEEVLQESFVKAYLALPHFKGDSSFYTWLFRIVRNMSIDVKRKLARRFQAAPGEIDLDRSPAGDAAEFVSSPVRPDQALQNKQEIGILERALSNISPEHKDILVLREIDGFSYEEISDFTGLSSGTVMSRLFYARKALLKAISEIEQGRESEKKGAALLRSVKA